MNNELETTDYNIIEQDSNTATSNSTTLTIGMVLDGKYEIRREIARGGMGIVYEAYHKVFNKKVAIKIILSDIIDSLQFKRFQKEVEAYSNLAHPNIIHIYNSGIYENTPYIVMDYIDGVNICQYVAQHDENYRKQKLHNAELGIKRDWKLCVKLIYETALALEYIHKQKMIHRDIKPSNIIVRSDGTPIIIDLGLAKFHSEKFTSLTTSGELLGTLQYMPIEQAQGKHGKIDARSDIYSLGLVLYELLTGEMAYSGENPMEICYNILAYYPPLPSKFNSQIPETLEKITMHAIDKKKENRYATAQEFANELKKYLDDENLQATKKYNYYKKLLRLQRNKKRIIVCCIALILVIISIIAIITSDLLSFSIPQDPKIQLEVAKQLYYKLDYSKAFNLFLKLSDSIEAQYFLGEMYYFGNGVKQDYSKAFDLLSKVANHGFIPAQHHVAYMYYKGLGIDKDYEKAFEYFQNAANFKSFNLRGEAQYYLYEMYYNGKGVKQDSQEALSWLKKAANNDYKPAIQLLEIVNKH